ncbi:hypothetical protein DI09_3p390 [Mitosporidium daphniae]|uniref:Uncharacterized protein n=1 Tax=Mitosporidium daphniae TaxID=1485682 RepID=A0A098VQG3_9MICR|nr:uncharacterized protein DI09_3p390 [Mitosporidium daphniae]KGG51277.1 hypothetical protein DI09_3p390 [Mitosporidium daphniae]|eukprot:XP_013237704.1 uncharacterized protein DI09_3p390 [Mitosporidium daphniae]
MNLANLKLNVVGSGLGFFSLVWFGLACKLWRFVSPCCCRLNSFLRRFPDTVSKGYTSKPPLGPDKMHALHS